MSTLGIRNRVLLAALLPVALFAATLVTLLMVGRIDDLETAHQQRAWSLARQIASAGEYGMFSGNRDALQSLVHSAKRETDVRSASFIDADGRVLARTGQPSYAKLPAVGDVGTESYDRATRTRLLTEPIYGSQLPLDDPFDSTTRDMQPKPSVLGWLVLEMSLDKVLNRQRELLLVGIMTTLAGLLFGGLLAVRLSRGVIEPIIKVCDVVERIAQGDLSARVEVAAKDDSLRHLEDGVNNMATRIESWQDELRVRIDEATAELRDKKEEAERATLAQSRFLTSASHDLRQPMHALGMFIGRLSLQTHDEQSRHLIDRIDASVRAMQNLLDALLDISRLEAGVLRVQTQHFPVKELFEQLHSDFAAIAEDKGLSLRFRPSRLWLDSDLVLLHRIVLNLVSNALRYTPRGGVLVASRKRGDHVLIEVCDTGIGIAPEFQAEIFMEFVQIANPERNRNKGLGLGLAIVERTARLLGHPLRLVSQPGRGSRFTIEVPAAPAAAQSIRPVSAPIAPGQFANIRLLVIDDDELIRQGLTVLLESWGCQVSAAEDLTQALQLVRHDGRPDLIACDYRLSNGANGLDAIKVLRGRNDLDVPAFLISADTDAELIRSAGAAGITLLHKPVRPARLRALMQQLLQRNEDDAVA